MTTAPADLTPPRPLVTPAARPFWDCLAEHRIVIQRCRSCERWVHYPRALCPWCGSLDLSFTDVSGRATIHTFTVARQATAPHFHDEVPQVIAIVELDVGVRLTTTLVTDDPGSLAIGQRVDPVFDDGDDGITLLRFRRTDS